MVGYKTCVACGVEKPIRASFRTNIDGCKECEANPEIDFDRKCSKCGEMKSIKNEFPKQSTRCKDCCSKVPTYKTCDVCREEKHKTEFRRGQTSCKTCETNGDAEEAVQECRECSKEKPKSEFRSNRRMCKDCERSYGRTYRRTTTKAKEWADANKERVAELQHEWYQENKPKIRQAEKEKLEADVWFKKVKNSRSLVKQLYTGKVKNSKVFKCSHQVFEQWINYNKTDDMTIENYADMWQFDHVIPVDLLLEESSQTKFSAAVKSLNSQNTLIYWYNIVPLKKKDNRDKSNDVHAKTILNHLKNLKKFIDENNVKVGKDYRLYILTATKIVDICYSYKPKSSKQ